MKKLRFEWIGPLNYYVNYLLFELSQPETVITGLLFPIVAAIILAALGLWQFGLLYVVVIRLYVIGRTLLRAWRQLPGGLDEIRY